MTLESFLLYICTLGHFKSHLNFHPQCGGREVKWTGYSEASLFKTNIYKVSHTVIFTESTFKKIDSTFYSIPVLFNCPTIMNAN